MPGVVLISMLLNGHIGQMNKLIVHLCNLWTVLDVAKAGKAQLRHVNLQRVDSFMTQMQVWQQSTISVIATDLQAKPCVNTVYLPTNPCCKAMV